jgi:hypothetical protein
MTVSHLRRGNSPGWQVLGSKENMFEVRSQGHKEVSRRATQQVEKTSTSLRNEGWTCTNDRLELSQEVGMGIGYDAGTLHKN